VLKGEKLLRQGRVDEAIERLEHAVELLPQEARAWNQLGLAYHAAGRGEDAERAYRTALDRDRNLAVARFNLGNLFLEQGQAERAVPELITFTGLRVNALEGWLRLGHAQLQTSQPAAAERSFLRAYQLQTNSAAALNGYGLSMVQRGRYADAWHCFSGALQREPGYAPALLNAGILAQRHLQQTNLAMQTYERYLALPNPPRKAEVEELLAQLRVPAITNTELAMATRPSQPTLTNQPPQKTNETSTAEASESLDPEQRDTTPAAPTTAGRGEPDGSSEPQIPEPTQPTLTTTDSAKTTSTEEARTPPAEPKPEPETQGPAETKPAVPSTDQHEEASARTSTQRVDRLPPSTSAPSNATTREAVTSPVAREEPEPEPPRPPAEVDVPPALQGIDGPRYPYYAYGQPRTGDRNEAIRLLNLGINDQRALRTQLALETYRRAVELDPSLFETHYNRGVAAFELGQLPEAMRAYERALAVDPDSVPARFNFATTLQKAGYLIDAAAQLSALVEEHPEEMRAHLALGNLFADKFQDNARAADCYRRVLELEPQHPKATSLRFWIEAH
jgi:tetratricopeptide (TPR) repeat protein